MASPNNNIIYEPTSIPDPILLSNKSVLVWDNGWNFENFLQFILLKFIYSEKATKFCDIFPLLLTLCTVVKRKGKISQNFVAFSEYMNFTSRTANLALGGSRKQFDMPNNLLIIII